MRRGLWLMVSELGAVRLKGAERHVKMRIGY